MEVLPDAAKLALRVDGLFLWQLDLPTSRILRTIGIGEMSPHTHKFRKNQGPSWVGNGWDLGTISGCGQIERLSSGSRV
jgi:hypothetical protein